MKQAEDANRLDKPVFEEGVFLGVRDKSNEIIVGNKHGVAKCRDFRRRPPSEQWRKQAVSEIPPPIYAPNLGVEDMRIRHTVPITFPEQLTDGLRPEGHGSLPQV